MSTALAVIAAVRGLDLLDAAGNQARYVNGFDVLGLHGWGILFLIQAASILVGIGFRIAGPYLPLFAAHVAGMFTYTTIAWVIVSGGDHSYLWIRGLIGTLAVLAMHAARAGALLFERMTEAVDAHGGH